MIVNNILRIAKRSKSICPQLGFVLQKHTLPDLSYDYGALEPTISAEIMQLHHSKHHAAYVNNLNIAEEKLAEATAKGDTATAISLGPALKFNGGGHINHSIFWNNLSPKGGEPQGDLLEAIKKDFKSLENLQNLLSTAAVGVQGSGWAWLGFHPVSRTLQIATCANQDPLQPTTGEDEVSMVSLNLHVTHRVGC
ncbi:superoxide dismutase [Mn], mitochondrial-like [Uloborus diversus]|uniref:superoxide dismutase [Mn], mitochondrial-like n=1 Tax=Uloborus diversus TaxID=327109 RepID=UPI0024098F95|nr:superoxide dismutase [Mn], mitochondrial-like [Uloborus diversus]